jgi:hypothetical protein
MISDFFIMQVSGLTIDPFTNMPIIILKDATETMALPIWVGLIEASAIATEIEKISMSRPMTHDLIRNLLHELGATMIRAEIYDLADNTFFARCVLQPKDQAQVFMLEARPSDAIALALRMKAPISVARKVVEKARQIDMGKGLSETEIKEQKWAEILENLSPTDFGKYKM